MSILQDALQGQISKQAAEEKLRQIEDEALLAQDLETLEQLTYQDLNRQNGEAKGSAEKALLGDRVCLGTVREIEQKKQYYQYTTYEVQLQPDEHGMRKSGEAAVSCNLVVKKEDRTFFLTVFEPEDL